MVQLTLYSRPGCHLCDEMKATVSRVSETVQLAVEEIDISTNPDLERRYGEDIPVLLVEGRKVAKYRITVEELLRVVTNRGV
jgi:thiol-disulfide isomerase/thioredoxin